MKHINSLDDDCLRLIFTRIPLQQYPALSTVCPQWAVIIRQICVSKRSLHLFYLREHAINYWHFLNGSNLQNDSDFKLNDNVIIYSEIDESIDFDLTDLLPNIVGLVCHMPLGYLGLLLSRWTDLSFLCLFMASGVHDYSRRGVELSPIFVNIDEMTSLSRLHLFYLNQNSLPCSLAVLPQLEQFSLVGYRGDIVPVVSQLGPNCRKLWLEYIDCVPRQFELINQLNGPLMHSVTHLTIGFNRPLTLGFRESFQEMVHRLLQLICDQFQQLEFVQFKSSYEISLHDVLTELSRLPHLTSLCLDVGENLFLQSNTPRVSLPSVKNLSLFFIRFLGLGHSFWQLPDIFPGIEQLSVISRNDAFLDEFRNESFTAIFSNLQKCTVTSVQNDNECPYWRG